MQVEEVLWKGRSCWALANDQIRVVITQWGAQFAEIAFLDAPTVSPLWVPPWTTMDGGFYRPEIHASVYGGTSESRLLSGLCGHNLCFPFWGDPTEAEFHAGMTFHGEANLSRWNLQQVASHSVVLTGLFKESHLRMNREITLSGSVIECRSRAENLSAWDRPVAWCEHVTFGPPFLVPGVTRFAASAGQGFRTGHEQDEAFFWPLGKGEIECDLSTFSPRQHRDLVNSFLVSKENEKGWFIARNEEQGLEVEYRFPVGDFPWLNIWENYDDRMLTRGMEFSNTPRHGTMKALVKTPNLLGTSAFDWIDGKGQLQKTFEVELRRIRPLA